MHRLFPLLLSLAVLSAAGCCDGSFGDPGDGGTSEPVTTDIRTLCETFVGETVVVTGDLVVAGRVTAAGRGGNFYRTLCIESDGAGLEIRAAVDQLYNDFPEGCSVTLRLGGLALGRDYGVLQAGVLPGAGSSYAADCIPSKAALDAVLVRNGESLQPVSPAVRTLSALTPEMCGTLVRIDGVRYAPEAMTSGSWAGYKRFLDDDGNAIFTYVSSYADFAGGDVPVGRCSLTGQLRYDEAKERFILRLRDEKDCAF